jgi:hypothetical protein
MHQSASGRHSSLSSSKWRQFQLKFTFFNKIHF